jgi:cyclase
MENGLYKTVMFNNPEYIGDPINAVKIFNEKEVDELILLDITATSENKEIQYDLIKDIVSEAFMPICYGGGVQNIKQIKRLLKIGIEKISINSHAINEPYFIKEISDIFGNSTIVVSIDIRKSKIGKYTIYTERGSRNAGLDPIQFAKDIEKMGAGELLVTSINNEGTMQGYDIMLLKDITSQLRIPVIANGGAGCLQDMKKAIEETDVSAVAAGSMFMYHGPHRAVLINYPTQKELQLLFD